MKNWLYVNKRNDRKYVEIRRYDCGHYYYKQYIEYEIPEKGKNYMGCSLKQNRRGGVWRKTTRKWISEIIVEDYQIAG